MLKLESVALELLEYKVSEYRATRQVRGGVAAMWELYGHLSRQMASLSQEERARLETVSQSLNVISGGGDGSATRTPDIDTLVLGDTSVVELADEDQVVELTPAVRPEEREEQAVLQRLARRVWWEQLDEFVLKVAAGWRAERERPTARLMYATLHNLQRNSAKKTFAQDVNLRGFQVFEPIPELN
ncbi:MAG: hypothetical protein P8Y05_07440, partial [Deinococcales bacterium]